MAYRPNYTEEVVKLGDKWFGAHTGLPYEKGEVEEKGGETWSKAECEEGMENE